MNKKIYLLLATAAVFLMNSCKEKVVQVAAPLEVSVMHVLQQDVNIQSEFTGQT